MTRINSYLDENDDVKSDELREAIDPLCIMKRIEYVVQLAWGGPGYGFKITCDAETNDVIGGVFYYADWGTYEEIDLPRDEAEKVAEAYGIDLLP